MCLHIFTLYVVLCIRRFGENGTKLAKLFFDHVRVLFTHECYERSIHPQHHHHFGGVGRGRDTGGRRDRRARRGRGGEGGLRVAALLAEEEESNVWMTFSFT